MTAKPQPRVEETSIEDLEAKFDPTAPSFADGIDEIIKRVPPEEWDRLPVDLAENLDHYLYGAKKR